MIMMKWTQAQETVAANQDSFQSEELAGVAFDRVVVFDRFAACDRFAVRSLSPLASRAGSVAVVRFVSFRRVRFALQKIALQTRVECKLFFVGAGSDDLRAVFAGALALPAA